MTSRLSRMVIAAVCMAVGMGSAGAAQKLQWEYLQKRLDGMTKYRSVIVIIRDGHKHKSSVATVRVAEIVLSGRNKVETVARQDVTRVEVRERKRFGHIGSHAQQIGAYLAAPIMLPIMLGELTDSKSGSRVANFAIGALIFGVGAVEAVPYLAYEIASAPVFLAADGIALLKPPKAFEIVP